MYSIKATTQFVLPDGTHEEAAISTSLRTNQITETDPNTIRCRTEVITGAQTAADPPILVKQSVSFTGYFRVGGSFNISVFNSSQYAITLGSNNTSLTLARIY